MSRTINTNNIFNNSTIINSEIQKSNFLTIQSFWHYYRDYALCDELKTILEENNKIISEEPLKPDFVLKNKPFNKNLCFYEADERVRQNGFPRQNFRLNVDNSLSENENNSGEFSDSKNSSENSEGSSESLDNENGLEEEEEEMDESEKNRNKNVIEYNHHINAQKFINSYKNSNSYFPQEFGNENINFMNNLINMPTPNIIPFIKSTLIGGNNNDMSQNENNEIKKLFEINLNYKGWLVGNNKFNSFELYEFLVNGIEKNIKIDYITISNDITKGKFKGGKLYFILTDLFKEHLNPFNFPLDLFANHNNNNYQEYDNINNISNLEQNFNNYLMQEENHLNNDISDFGFKP